MDVIAYVEMNIISILMCIAIWHQQKRQDSQIIGDRSFNGIIWITVAILALDTLSWIMQEHYVQHKYWMHMTVLCGYSICQTLLPLLLVRYCIFANGKRISKWQEIVLVLPLVLVTVGLLVNIYHPFAFCLIENERYERMPGFMMLGIWPILYVIVGLVIGVIHYGHAEDKETAKHLVRFIVIALIAGIIGAFNYKFSIWPVVAFDIEYLYLNVQSKREKEMDMLAFQDSLTGLKNATAYRHALNQLDGKITNKTALFAVVVMDINGLKQMNDQYGHEAGDRLLITAGKFICNIFTHSPVFRIGGDEFVAILEGTDYEHREELLKKFDEKMTSEMVTVAGTEIPVSIARGIADYSSKDEMHYSDVFQAADQAMYKNKVLIKANMQR